MTAVDEREAIGTLFSGNYAGDEPVSYPNRKFVPPDDGTTWLKLSIAQVEAFQVEIGAGPDGNQKQYAGTVLIQVFAPVDKGDNAPLVVAEAVAQVFRDTKTVTFTGGDVRFRTPVVRAIGGDGTRADMSDSTYYQVNVSIPFVREEVG